MKENLKAQINQMLESKQKKSRPSLYCFEGSFKLTTITKGKSVSKLLSESEMLSHLKNYPDTHIMFFRVAGGVLPSWLNGLRAEIREIFPHQIDDLKSFISYMNSPINQAILIDQLPLEEIKILAGFSRIIRSTDIVSNN